MKRLSDLEPDYNGKNSELAQIYVAEKTIPLKIMGCVRKSCVRSAMHYESETWCVVKNYIGIFQRAEGAMVRSMCGVKLMDNKSMKNSMRMIDLNEA